MSADTTTVVAPPWLSTWAGEDYGQSGSGPGLLGVLADGVVSEVRLPGSYRPQVLAEICAAVAGAVDTVMAKYQPAGGGS